MVDRILPHDIDAEEATLGSIIIDSSTIRKVMNTLKPTDFYSERNRWIYEQCLKLYSEYTAINTITLAQSLTQAEKLEACGGAAFLSHIQNVTPTSLDIEYYGQIVFRLAVSRRMIEAAEKLADIGYKASGNIDEAIQNGSIIWDSFKKGSLVSSKVTTPYMASNDILDLIEKYSDPGNAPSWGFQTLDDITAGIFAEYVIIAGYTSTGKTQLGFDIAENAVSQGQNVLFCSAEMTNNQIYERKLTKELGTSILNLRKYGIKESDTSKIVMLSGEVSQSTMNMLTGDLYFRDIYKEAYTLKNQGKLDMIFIDYIGALRDCYDGKKESQNVRVSEVSNRIQGMKKEFNIPIITLCQLNRESQRTQGGFKPGTTSDRRPQLSDLRDSGSLEQDADVVFLLYRPKDDNGEITNLLEVKMAKNRQLGAHKHVTLVYDYNLRKLRDMT